MIWCPTHKKTALCSLDDIRGFFFASAPVKTGHTWYEAITTRLKEVLRTNDSSGKKYLPHTPLRLIHTFRLQIPNYCDFISRYIFLTEVSSDPKYLTNCCVDSKIVSWFSAEDLISDKVTNVWGPEPQMFVEALVNNHIEDLGTFSEFALRDVLLFSAKDRPKVVQDEMVKSTGFTDKDIYKMFGDFFQHTFPSQYMNWYSFDNYMSRFGALELTAGSPLSPKGLYRAFAFSGRPFISFHEFLLGLCALDKNIQHGGRIGELRSTYIFRYYSEDKKYLKLEDLKNFFRDINRIKGQSDENQIEAEARELISSIMGTESQKRLDEKTFIKSVGQRRVRGTSTLFRSVTSPLQQIRLKRVYDSIQFIQYQSVPAIDVKLQRMKGMCKKCRQKKYTLALHTVKLSKEGLIIDPKKNIGQSDAYERPRSLRRLSEMSFSASSANFLLDILRTYAYSGAIAGLNTSNDRNHNRSPNKATVDLWSSRSSRLQQVDKMLSLCAQCGAIFKKEQRMIRISSPIFVLGDIHGNFHDLMIYERWLWRMRPTCVASGFLFLGDYVDRGENGVECIVYLLANKVLSPERFHLLRGNHELRPVQTTFTFKSECLDKFGSKIGLQVWEAFNRVFDLMPICALIDESIFCTHGGIPTTSSSLDEILKIPSPLEDPENESPIAWQILWNDPVTSQEFRDYQQMMKEQRPNEHSSGFLPNTKRGTAFFYSDQALNQFLAANQLTHVIRAHEVIPNGYAFHMGGKCITIFSSSRYCGGLNEAAVVLVNDEKIRVIKIDTN